MEFLRACIALFGGDWSKAAVEQLTPRLEMTRQGEQASNEAIKVSASALPMVQDEIS